MGPNLLESDYDRFLTPFHKPGILKEVLVRLWLFIREINYQDDGGVGYERKGRGRGGGSCTIQPKYLKGYRILIDI